MEIINQYKSNTLDRRNFQPAVFPHVCSSTPESHMMTFDSLRSGNPKKHIAALKKAVDTVCLGEPSLYNSLNLAVQTLKSVLPESSLKAMVSLHCISTSCILNCFSEDTCLGTRAGRSSSSSAVWPRVTQPTSTSWLRKAAGYVSQTGFRARQHLLLTHCRSFVPQTDSEISEGASVGHRPVSGGARVHGADERDGRLLPRHPGWGSLQRAADAARQTSSG